MPPSLLRLGDVRKSFGAVRALKGVSFGLEPGEVHALVGENSAGKSTLVKLITGAERPDAGSIEVAAQKLDHLSPLQSHKLGIACIYQQPALFPDLTVAETLGLRLEEVRVLARVNWASRQQIAMSLLHRMGAEISPEAEVRSLS